jgi:lipoprotein-releasing system permease protein
MITSSAIITGFKKEINSKIFGFWGHIHVSEASTQRNFELKPISIDSSYYDNIQKLSIVNYEKQVTKLGKPIPDQYESAATLGGVKFAQPYIVLPCLIETKQEMVAGLFKGLGSLKEMQHLNRFIIQGSNMTVADTSGQILVSKIIAEKLYLKVGQKIILSFIKDGAKLKRVLAVKGIYNTGLEEYDERFLIGHAALAQEILSWQKDWYACVEVYVDHVEDINPISDYIYATILPDNIYAETIQEKFPNIFEWLKLQDINERIILQLMGLVAIINLITVLLILILERTEMVGILKSIGASNWMIRKIFIYHATYILIAGVILGNIIALVLCYIQKSTSFIKLDEKNYYLDVAPVHIDWTQIGLINLGAIIVCVLTLLLPSYLIAKLKPVSALKFT